MSADRPGMRLSDAERQEAMDALSEHVRTGRLDIDEFGSRSATVSAAKTSGDLAPLFEDLPAPRPSALAPVRAGIGPVAAVGASPASKLAASAVPIAAVVAVVLFLTVARGYWFVFLLPAVVALLAGSWSGGRRS